LAIHKKNEKSIRTIENMIIEYQEAMLTKDIKLTQEELSNKTKAATLHENIK